MTKSKTLYAITLTLVSTLAGTGCTAGDGDRYAPAQPLEVAAPQSGSAAELLGWYEGLSADEQGAVIDILAAHAAGASDPGQATLRALRADQAALMAALEGVLSAEHMASFPSPGPLGAPAAPRGPGAQVLIDGDEHDGVAYYGTSSYHWNKTSLTYCIDGYLDGVSNDRERNQYEKAAAEWASHSSLSFSKVSDCAVADIKIKAKGKDHNEDGCGGFSSGSVLAHAKYPTSSNNRVYMHMNNKFRWDNVGSMDGFEKALYPDTYDLRTVAIHELGHNLGISHTSYGNAVMYPSIGALEKKWNLHSDDIAAVQSLYSPSFADAAYAKVSFAQSEMTRSLLLLTVAVEDSDEARALYGQLTEDLARLDGVVEDLRDAAITEPGAEILAAHMERLDEVLGQLRGTWVGFEGLGEEDPMVAHAIESMAMSALGTLDAARGELEVARERE